jgi:hypothetical protein
MSALPRSLTTFFVLQSHAIDSPTKFLQDPMERRLHPIKHRTSGDRPHSAMKRNKGASMYLVPFAAWVSREKNDPFPMQPTP